MLSLACLLPLLTVYNRKHRRTSRNSLKGINEVTFKSVNTLKLKIKFKLSLKSPAKMEHKIVTLLGMIKERNTVTMTEDHLKYL
jgi:hypothetical protein